MLVLLSVWKLVLQEKILVTNELFHQTYWNSNLDFYSTMLEDVIIINPLTN